MPLALDMYLLGLANPVAREFFLPSASTQSLGLVSHWIVLAHFPMPRAKSKISAVEPHGLSEGVPSQRKTEAGI